MLRFLYRLILATSLTMAVAVVAFRVAAINREAVSAEALLTPQSRMVETIHGRIHVMEAGPEDGTPVLLIHGSVGWAGLWRATMGDLASRGYRAMAIDLPPMGLSDRDTRTDFSRQAQGLRILAFAEAAQVRPIIVAHSFGAGAAVEAMMAAPDTFAGGVIIAGALGLGDDGTGQTLPLPLQPRLIREAAMAATVTNPYATKWLFRQFVYRKDSIDADTVAVLEYPFLRNGTTETLAAWLPTLLVAPRGAASSDPARYATLAPPVVLIWGREDTVTPPDQAEALRAALGDAPLFWMGETGHIPQIEAPDTFHRLLANALEIIEKG